MSKTETTAKLPPEEYIIKIRKSPTADTRVCDFKNVSKEVLMDSTMKHRMDVQKGINYIRLMLFNAMMNHDHTKISGIDQFYEDFKSGFKRTNWYDNHVKEERHHLTKHVPEDVDLVDVIECLVDGVMAGMGRTGEYRKEELPEGLFQTAFDNTAKKLIAIIQIEEEPKPKPEKAKKVDTEKVNDNVAT